MSDIIIRDSSSARSEIEQLRDDALNYKNQASVSATNSATSEANASVSEANAQDSADEASISASQASIASASVNTGVSNANNYATQASVYADNSQASAVASANSATSSNSYATQASGYKDTATTQAGIATTKASEASVSANQALAYRNESQVDRIATGEILAEFQSLYYGARNNAEIPEDVDVEDGDLYYNTDTNSMMLRSNGVWVVAVIDADTIGDISIIGDNIVSINTVSSSVPLLNDINDNITPNLTEILASEGYATIASAKASEASVSADSATLSASNAVTSLNATIVARDDSIDAKDIAVASKDSALISAANALTSEQNAASSEANILALEAQVSSNTSDIVTNESNISSNTSDIVTNTSNIVTINNALIANDLLVNKNIVDISANAIAIQANSQAIANLATSYGSISNTTTPVFANVPLVSTIMPFTVDIDSTNDTIFTFDDINNTITLLKNINYNFLSNVTFESSTNVPVGITFNLVDVSDSSVIKQQVANLEIDNGDKATFPMNTLITVGSNGIPSAPLTIGIEALADNTGYSLESFNSTLASSAIAATLTDTPILSIASEVNEKSDTTITITNHDSEATYTFNSNVGTIAYTSGNTAIFTAKTITDGNDDIGIITCSATKLGELRSDLVSYDITIKYVPLASDSAVTFNFATDTENVQGFE